jgi:hypothetical protein
MSRQEFLPHEQEPLTQDDPEKIDVRPYSWSTSPKSGNLPKNEHPSTFEDSIPPIPPYSYAAQDALPPQQEQEKATYYSGGQEKQSQQQQAGPQRNTFQYGYRPYTSYNTQSQVPPWARPQHHNRRAFRWVILFILGMIFLNPLLHVLGWLAVAFGVIFIIFAVIVGAVAIMALVVLSALGIPLRIGRRHAYRRWYRRGPWSW